MSNFVLVIDTNRKPLAPCHPAYARKLLRDGKAAVIRKYPFTIILKKEVVSQSQTIQLKIDPGSKTTGIALVQEDKVVWAAEIQHRGQQIRDALTARRQVRRSRRQRKTRYRQPRFLNRTRPEGWLPPSLRHRVETTITWVNRLRKFVPISGITMELVQRGKGKGKGKGEEQELSLVEQEWRINPPARNPIGAKLAYSQFYLSYPFPFPLPFPLRGRHCTYCGKTDVPLEVEHINPKSKGGSNRVSNLTLACNACNKAKGDRDIRDFLSSKTELLNKILSQAKQPLRDAAAVNSTRWAQRGKGKGKGKGSEEGGGKLELELLPCLVPTIKIIFSPSFLPLSLSLSLTLFGTGGRTKYNRCRLNLPKTHWLDAACVGNIESLELLTNKPLQIKATGHGTRQMCRTDKFGFPCRYIPQFKFVKGFQTGDIVKATVTKGKKVGSYVGRVAVRTTGSFNISTSKGLIQGISHKYCTVLHRKDGYNYSFNIDAC